MTPLLLLAETAGPGLAASLKARWEVVRPYATSPILWAMVFALLGIWLLLPRGNTRLRPLGALVAAASLGLLATVLPFFGDWFERGLFWVLAGATTAAAVATISMRSPVYSAIWFALTLLTTSGLFLLLGAQFLGVATIVVYAGAILVTFLFVLMLAQPQGHAFYDRISWGAVPTTFATLAGVLIVGGLTFRLGTLQSQQQLDRLRPPVMTLWIGQNEYQVDPERNGLLHEQHVAKLGNELFSRHLVSLEAAGTLLLVALVGAVAIMIQGRGGQVRTTAAAPERGGPGHG